MWSAISFAFRGRNASLLGSALQLNLRGLACFVIPQESSEIADHFSSEIVCRESFVEVIKIGETINYIGYFQNIA